MSDSGTPLMAALNTTTANPVLAQMKITMSSGMTAQLVSSGRLCSGPSLRKAWPLRTRYFTTKYSMAATTTTKKKE